MSSPLTMWLLVLAGATTLVFLAPLQLLPRIYVLPLGVVAWIAISLYAYAHHKSAPKPTSHVSSLVTSGPYRYVRHPFYAADILLAATVAFSYPQTTLAMLYATTVFVWWAVREERELEKRFPDYDDYRKRTGMFFPKRNS